MAETSPEDQERRSILRAARVALLAWPAFAALDLYMCFVLFPRANLSLVLLYRVVGEFLNFGAWWTAQRSDATPGQTRAAHIASYSTMALFISLMSLEVGGLHSRYVHGISIVVMVRAIVVPARYTKSFVWSLPILLAYPLVHVAAWRVFGVEGSRFTLHDLAVFVSDYVFLLGSTVVGSVSGHVIWSAEQQLYRARRIGRYRLEAPVARGGMGEIWLAWDETLKRSVALKILRAEGGDATAIARFEREAHAASTLTNPHTIRIFDYGASDDGLHFIAMEYLPGADLAAVVATHGPMPVARAVSLIRQACESLSEAHDSGIIHRDVKPQNLYATRVGDDHDFLKLLDFGIARVAVGEGDAALTHTGALPGTPLYMAPEQWGHGVVDARCDIYGLGATLYFLLTGHPPRDPAQPWAQRRSVESLRGQPIPAELDAVIERCLAQQPDARFSYARELAAALEACPLSDRWSSADARQFWLVTHREASLRREPQTPAVSGVAAVPRETAATAGDTMVEVRRQA